MIDAIKAETSIDWLTVKTDEEGKRLGKVGIDLKGKKTKGRFWMRSFLSLWNQN